MDSNLLDTTNWLSYNIVSPIVEGINSSKYEQIPMETLIEGIKQVRNTCQSTAASEVLYNYYCYVLRTYARKAVLPELLQCNLENITEMFYARWETNKLLVYWLKKVFSYLEIHYIPESGKDSLEKVGLEIFRSQVFHQISQMLAEGIVTWLQTIRNGFRLDSYYIKRTIMSFIEIEYMNPTLKKTQTQGQTLLEWQGSIDFPHYYREHFETLFFHFSQAFYSQFSQSISRITDLTQYLTEAKNFMDSETALITEYLHESSIEPFKQIITTELLESFKTYSENSTELFLKLFNNENWEQLKDVYRIFENESAIKLLLQNQLGTYLDLKLNNLIHEHSKSVVSELVLLKEETELLVEYCFLNSRDFKACISHKLNQFINTQEGIIPSIVEYCDFYLKEGIHTTSEKKVSKHMDQINDLVAFIREKDIFLTQYSKYLSKRLLENTNVPEYFELQMINKFKIHCAGPVLNKLLSMLKDINVSEQIVKEYCDKYSHHGSPLGVEFNVKLITSNAWPEQEPEPCKLTGTLTVIMNDFEMFYQTTYEKRKLTWVNQAGSLELLGYFGETYTLVLNPIQTTLLLHLEHQNSMSLQELKKLTGLNEKALKANIIMLFNPKYPLLLKQSKGKKIQESEAITLNEDFSSKTRKINYLPKPLKKRLKIDKEEQSVVKGRTYIIESVIIKVCKTHKTIYHRQLLKETINNVTSFSAQPQQIKERIDSLILRGLLTRDDKESNLYYYIDE